MSLTDFLTQTGGKSFKFKFDHDGASVTGTVVSAEIVQKHTLCAILTDAPFEPWCVYDGRAGAATLHLSHYLSHEGVRGWTPVEDQPAADPARVLPDGHVAIDLSDIGTDELRRHHRSGSVIEGDGRGSVSSVFSGVLDDLIVCELERRGEAL